MKRLLNETQIAALADTVAASEKLTRAEIVTVLAPSSDNYQPWALLVSAVTALLVSALASVAVSGWSPPAWLHLLPVIALLLFAGLVALLQVPALLRPLVPKRLRHARAAAMARAQFLAQNLHHTRGETGVLIFVSEFERYVEVLVDRGIAQHIPDSAWQQVVADFTAQVKAGEVEAGFRGAIERCGKLLAEKLPPDSDNPNELPNRLVILN